jgi:hypothetical protein
MMMILSAEVTKEINSPNYLTPLLPYYPITQSANYPIPSKFHFYKIPAFSLTVQIIPSCENFSHLPKM